MRWWRWALLVLSVIAAAVAATVVAIAVNIATADGGPGFPALQARPLWWVGGGTVLVATTALAGLWTQNLVVRRLPPVPAEQSPEPWVVDRPQEVDRIVEALRRHGSPTVGVTTALQGAGGFGKTTLAKLVRADQRVLRRFGRHIYWVTLGRDARRGILTDKINDLIHALDPDRQIAFTDAQQAGQYLSGLLQAGPRRLIVLDDVWFPDQLDAFPLAGGSARLVTTRNATLVVGDTITVRVDQFSPAQARASLLADLPPLPAALVDGILDETGRWPLLLRLTNRILADQARSHTDLVAVAQQLLDRLRRDGIFEIDDLTGAAQRELDVNDPAQRQQAIAATIDASVDLLHPIERRRLAELSVFADDDAVPVAMTSDLWQATGGLDLVAARALCARLDNLSLISLTATGDGGAFTVHDVIREALRRTLGKEQLRSLHEQLLTTAAQQLNAREDAPASWWLVPGSHPYLGNHLIEHLLAAGRDTEAEELAGDIRWVIARLKQAGPLAPLSDLALIPSSAADHLRQRYGQIAHLLMPTDPPHSRNDILRGRLAHDPVWGPRIAELGPSPDGPALLNAWQLPDLPEPTLRRTIIGHTAAIRAIAIAPSSDWLVTASADRSVRIWHAATGAQRMMFTGHTDRVNAVAVAADGTWLASAGSDRSIRICNVATGIQRARLTGHRAQVNALVIAPDGSWLASVSDDNSLRIWDVTTGRQRYKMTGHSDRVTSVAVDGKGDCVATASADRSVRIWSVLTGREEARLVSTDWALAVAFVPNGTWLAIAGWSLRIWNYVTNAHRTDLTSHTDDLLNTVAVAPDGSWLATGGDDRSTKIWDAMTGERRSVLHGHIDPVNAVTIAPDGTWLATASSDWSVRIWDTPGTLAADNATRGSSECAADADRSQWFFAVAEEPKGRWLATGSVSDAVQTWHTATGYRRLEFAERTGRVNAVAIAPDGTWLASAGWSVRLVDAHTGTLRNEILGHVGSVFAVAISPDGSLLVTGGDDRTVRVWDAVTGAELRVLVGHNGRVNAVAISPDGTWLASAGTDGLVRIWETRTGVVRRQLTGHAGRVNAVAISPDGTWLASAGTDGLVRVWNARTGVQQSAFAGHAGRVNTVAISPDGRWLATAGSDRTVRVWEAGSHQVRAMTRLEQTPHSCVWSPDGASLTVAGAGGLYRFVLRPAR